MELDMVILLSGWVFGIGVLIYHVTQAYRKLTPKEYFARYMEVLNAYWDNPHMRKRAEKLYAHALTTLSKWWRADDEAEEEE